MPTEPAVACAELGSSTATPGQVPAGKVAGGEQQEEGCMRRHQRLGKLCPSGESVRLYKGVRTLCHRGGMDREREDL